MASRYSFYQRATFQIAHQRALSANLIEEHNALSSGLDQQLPIDREADPLSVAHKWLNSMNVLKRADRLAECRLGDPEFVRRSAKVAVGGERTEVSGLLDVIHVRFLVTN